MTVYEILSLIAIPVAILIPLLFSYLSFKIYNVNFSLGNFITMGLNEINLTLEVTSKTQKEFKILNLELINNNKEKLDNKYLSKLKLPRFFIARDIQTFYCKFFNEHNYDYKDLTLLITTNYSSKKFKLRLSTIKNCTIISFKA